MEASDRKTNLNTSFECPLIGNGDSVIITNERHKAELLYARRVEPRVYRPLPCAQRMAGGFLFNRKLRSLLNKNAPRRSHCGGKENVAFATRRRRRILQSRILSYASVPACRLLRHGRQGKNKKWQKEIQR